MIGLMIHQRMGIKQMQKEIQPYRNILMLSAFLSAVFVMALHMSTEYIPSGTSSIIVNLSPIIVLIYGGIFLSEKLSITKIAGFLLGLVGGIAFFWSSLVFMPGLEWGIILALIAIGLGVWNYFLRDSVNLPVLSGLSSTMVWID